MIRFHGKYNPVAFIQHFHAQSASKRASLGSPMRRNKISSRIRSIQPPLAEDSVVKVQSTPFLKVQADCTVREATEALHKAKVSSLLVVDKDKLAGIFTERDFLEKVAHRFPQVASKPVRQVMTSNPTVVYETDPVGTAVAAIAVAGHRHVPVLRMDGTIIGVVSPKRVLRFLDEHFD